MRVTGFGVVAALLLPLAGCDHGSPPQAFDEPDPVVVEAQQQFTYEGKPIPPFFLADFYGGPYAPDFWTKGMGARIAAIRVAGLFDRRDGAYAFSEVEESEDGWLSFDLSDEERRGYLSYRFVGTSPSGVTVIEYVGNTGGSGTITGIVLLRFEMGESGATADIKHRELLMRFVGEESWGDRVYRDVKLTGNSLWLGPTRTHIPAYQDMNEGERTIVLE